MNCFQMYNLCRLLKVLLFNEKLSVPQVTCVILVVIGIAGFKTF